jgi:hypothetical protein
MMPSKDYAFHHGAGVRFWHKADMAITLSNVRGKADMRQTRFNVRS